MKGFSNLINRFFVWLQKNDVKGKYRFFLLTEKLFNNYFISHQSTVGPFKVPYSQWCFWKTLGPEDYYTEESLPFCEFINDHLDEFDFIDLGADVGVFSHLIALHSPKLQKIFAVEPNPKSHKLLELNAIESVFPYTTYNVAVSNYNGFADLEYNSSSHSDHEGHITNNDKGNTRVSTLDFLLKSTNLGEHLAIKIDVEGQEKNVIEGAAEILKNCQKAVLLIELHPDTLESHEISPESIFEAVEQLRDVKWFAPLLNKEINRKQPFFEQFPAQQYDVIGFIE